MCGSNKLFSEPPYKMYWFVGGDHTKTMRTFSHGMSSTQNIHKFEARSLKSTNHWEEQVLRAICRLYTSQNTLKLANRPLKRNAFIIGRRLVRQANYGLYTIHTHNECVSPAFAGVLNS
jgi:hypothetical protein